MPELLLTTYAPGMDASDETRRLLNKAQACAPTELYNATVRNGWLATRPGWQHIDIEFANEGDRFAFENGLFQGLAHYDAPSGARFVLAVDGWLWSFSEKNNKLSRIFLASGKPFSRYARQVFFAERGEFLIAQDGINPALILFDTNARLSSASKQEVPTGSVMADNSERLAVLTADGSKIRLSDHIFDPSSAPLQFTEETDTITGVRYFELSAQMRPAVAMAIMPSLRASVEPGPLIVFGKNQTRAYNIGLPRQSWLSSDITRTILPTIGASGARAVVQWGSELIFSDQHGRVRALSQAVSDEGDLALLTLDNPIWQISKNSDPRLLEYRRLTAFNHRLFMTTHPERVPTRDGRFNVRHRFLAVAEGILPGEFQQFGGRVWAGFWHGIQPLDLIGATDSSGNERLLCAALDGERKIRLYTLSRDNGSDFLPGGEKAITLSARLPRANFGAPFHIKPHNYAALKLGNIRGEVALAADWERDGLGVRHWFLHQIKRNDCLQFFAKEKQVGSTDRHFSQNCPEKTPAIPCQLQEYNPGRSEQIRLPSPPTICKSENSSVGFFSASITFFLTGKAQIEEFWWQTGDPKTTPLQTNVEKCPKPQTNLATACEYQLPKSLAATGDFSKPNQNSLCKTCP